jgi:hypothetical protein
LVTQALRHKDATYVNVSPAPHTRPIIEAQGFVRYCEGSFIAVPLLNWPLRGERAKLVHAHQQPKVAYDPYERELLLQHGAFGCISFWCVTSKGAYPFVFRPRYIRSAVPCAQLIYCRNIEDFVRFSGAIGWFLAMRGKLLVIIDADGPLPGLIGTFRASRPRYFRGPHRPWPGDLAYSEIAIFDL